MSSPREGARDVEQGIIISEAMDWCRSPVAIVPYRIWARQVQAAKLAYSVRQTDNFSHVEDSIVTSCYGDEAGTGGGVISGTHNAECVPKTWSRTVRFESRRTVRHDDLWWMNHKNTYGRLYYTKDMSVYDAPEPQTIEAKMDGNDPQHETGADSPIS